METRSGFAAVPSSIAEVRHAARKQAERLGADAAVMDALTLCVSEAVTNVVVHAYRDGREPGRLELATHRPDGFICVYVRDDGVGMTPRPDRPGAGWGDRKSTRPNSS